MLKIWQVNQADANRDESVDASAGCDWLLVRRIGFAVDIQPLGAGEFGMLHALREGQTVDDAYELALRQDAEFALGAFIERRILDSTIVGFEL